MFIVYMVIIVYRKLIAQLEDYCSNNGGLEKKFRCSVFIHRLYCCCLLNNATPAIYSCYLYASIGEVARLSFFVSFSKPFPSAVRCELRL